MQPMTIEAADLGRGLRSNEHNPRNEFAFVELRGTKSYGYGLVPFEAIPNPLAAWMAGAGISVSLPFPQFFRCRQASFVLIQTAVYLIDESVWTGAALTAYDAADVTYNYTVVPSGGAWQCVDCDGTVFFMNRANFLMYIGGVLLGTNTFTATAGCELRDRVLLAGFSNTAGAHWNVQWQAIEALLNTRSDSISLLGSTDQGRWVWWSSILGGNVSWWLWPVLALYGVGSLGAELPTNRTFRAGTGAAATDWVHAGTASWDSGNLEIDISGGAGSVSQTLAGTVSGRKYVLGFEVKNYAAGEFYVAFGSSKGIHRIADGYYWEEFTASGSAIDIAVHGNATASGSIDNVTVREILRHGYGLSKPFILDWLQRNDTGAVPMRWPGQVVRLLPLDKAAVAYCEDGVAALIPQVEPTPTLGEQRLTDAGIHGRAAAGGDQYIQIYVDKAGYVRMISAGLKVEMLDAHEWFEALTNITVAYDTARNEFHVAGRSGETIYSYCLTETGWCETPRCTTSVVVIEGVAQGVTEASERWSDFRAVTDTLDMGTRAMKTVTEIEIGLSSGSNAMTVQLDYKLDREDTDWRPGAPLILRGKGIAHTVTTGVEFRLVITAATYSTVEIDYIRLHWRPAGKVSVQELLGG